MRKINSSGMSAKRAKYLSRRKKRLSNKRKAAQPSRKAAVVEAPGAGEAKANSVCEDTCKVRGPPPGKELVASKQPSPEKKTTSLATYLGFLSKFSGVLAKGAIVCLAAVGLINIGSGSSDSAFSLSFKKDGAIVDLTVDVRSSEKTLSEHGLSVAELERIRNITRGIINSQGLDGVVPPSMTIVDSEALDQPEDSDKKLDGLKELYLNRLEILGP